MELSEVPAPFLQMGAVPAFVQDFYMNFKKFVWSEGKIDAKTKVLIAIAVAGVSKCGPWLDYLSDRAKSLGHEPVVVAETIAIAASCAMYNAFFKFRDISGSSVFEGMSVGLRAHTFAGTSLDDKTVELINLAISDINGCKPCTAGHLEKARNLGVTDEQALESIQCAATMLAGCQYLNAAN